MKQLMMIGVLLVVGVAAAWERSEEPMTLDQVPAAVRETILAEAGGAEVREIERETRDGETHYEAEWRAGGQEIEIRIAPDGTLVGRETEPVTREVLTLQHLPRAVQDTLRAVAGGAPLGHFERGSKHGVTVYEAAWSAGGARHEAEVTADGALLELEEIVTVDAVPVAVGDAIAQHFGIDTKVAVAKKTIVLYEVETRIDGLEHELLVLPTGRVLDRHDDDGDDDDGDDDDDDDDRDDDDDDRDDDDDDDDD
jgi:hypothetical protein